MSHFVYSDFSGYRVSDENCREVMAKVMAVESVVNGILAGAKKDFVEGLNVTDTLACAVDAMKKVLDSYGVYKRDLDAIADEEVKAC